MKNHISLFSLVIILSVFISFNSCTPEDNSPEVVTLELTDLTETTVKTGGFVTNDNEFEVIEKGIVWDIKSEPSIEDNQGFTKDGDNIGQYSSEITGLIPGTEYFIRAYATNSEGTGYGQEISFKTKGVAPVELILKTKLASVENIQSNSATVSMIIEIEQGALNSDNVKAGIILGENESINLENHSEKYDITAVEGITEIEVENLDPSTEYFVKSYAVVVNKMGEATDVITKLSNPENFTTLEASEFVQTVERKPEIKQKPKAKPVGPCPNEPTITDADGNVYKTVQIGNQCWMAENLKTTTFNNDKKTSLYKSNADEWSTIDFPAYVVYPHEEITDIGTEQEVIQKFGLLYNWFAASHSNNLCPTGWKVPTDEDWKELEGYVDSKYPVGDDVWHRVNEYRGTDNGKNLKAKSGWHNKGGGTDKFGFNAVAAGSLPDRGIYENAYYWTSSEPQTTAQYGTIVAWYRYIYFNNSQVFRDLVSKRNGYSIRCMKKL